jgi:APA family basic amino acid/polyamine antiporter
MWSYWISLWVTNAAVAVGAVSYLEALAPDLLGGGRGPVAAVGFVLLFTAIATRGVRASGAVQLATSVLKLMPLIAVIVLAVVVLGGGADRAEGGLAPMPLSPGAVAAAAALTLWAMLGFESATLPSGKVKRPERTVPRATLIGMLIVGAAYLLTSMSVFLLLPAEEAARSGAPLADLVSRYWGSGAAALVAAFAAISALGALNGWVLLQAEVPLALARSGVFPAAFARVNARGMPVFGQLVGAALTTALIATNFSRGLAGLFQFMILLATAATLVLYLTAALGALVLKRRGELPGGLTWATPALGTLFALWTLWGAGKEAVGWGAALLASGIPVFLVMRGNLFRVRTVEEPSSRPEG